MASDHWGSAPVAGAEVTLSGVAKAGAWHADARSDEHGLFFVPMPLGLTGQVAVTTRPPATEKVPETRLQFDAAGFQYGLSPANLPTPHVQFGWPMALHA